MFVMSLIVSRNSGRIKSPLFSSGMRTVDETTTDIICIKCKKDDSEFPNEIVLCDSCGIGEWTLRCWVGDASRVLACAFCVQSICLAPYRRSNEFA